ncbi:MAG: hypothetical protein ACRC3B_21935 [Bacteroidia bacterium]
MKPAPDTRKHQGLITSGIIIASLMLLFVLGSAAFTSIKIKTRMVQQEMAEVIDDMSIDMTDTAYTGNQEVAIDYSMVYTDQTLAEKEINNTNDINAVKQKLQTNGNNASLKKLNEFEYQTDLLCARIRALRTKLNDTVTQTGDYGNPALSIAFFNTDNRSQNLLVDLKNYRDKYIQAASSVGSVSQIESARATLPLDDAPAQSPTGYWDETRFYDSPEKAAQYLLELEFAVRYFEYDIIACYSN